MECLFSIVNWQCHRPYSTQIREAIRWMKNRRNHESLKKEFPIFSVAFSVFSLALSRHDFLINISNHNATQLLEHTPLSHVHAHSKPKHTNTLLFQMNPPPPTVQTNKLSYVKCICFKSVNLIFKCNLCSTLILVFPFGQSLCYSLYLSLSSVIWYLKSSKIRNNNQTKQMK